MLPMCVCSAAEPSLLPHLVYYSGVSFLFVRTNYKYEWASFLLIGLLFDVSSKF